MMMTTLQIKRIDKELPLPKYQTRGSAGIDLHIAETITLLGDCIEGKPFSFGIAVKIPEHYVGLVTTRSGLGFKFGVESRLGIIDSDFVGEIKGKIYNFSKVNVTLTRGDRVAQLLIVPAPQLLIREVDSLENTIRGEGGFGSTGV